MVRKMHFFPRLLLAVCFWSGASMTRADEISDLVGTWSMGFPDGYQTWTFSSPDANGEGRLQFETSTTCPGGTWRITAPIENRPALQGRLQVGWN